MSASIPVTHDAGRCRMTVLVCGGRDFTDQAAVYAALDYAHRLRGISCVVHGAARGADSLAGEWATLRGVQEVAIPADWKMHGRRAGPLRNQRMLDEMKPDGVIAFPGGAGTADMIRRARTAGVPVWGPSADRLREEVDRG